MKVLKVIYDGGQIDVVIDAAIERAIGPFGLRRLASRMDLATGKRTLEFKKEISASEGCADPPSLGDFVGEHVLCSFSGPRTRKV